MLADVSGYWVSGSTRRHLRWTRSFRIAQTVWASVIARGASALVLEPLCELLRDLGGGLPEEELGRLVLDSVDLNKAEGVAVLRRVVIELELECAAQRRSCTTSGAKTVPVAEIVGGETDQRDFLPGENDGSGLDKELRRPPVR
jgi:hypothetical protein